MWSSGLYVVENVPARDFYAVVEAKLIEDTKEIVLDRVLSQAEFCSDVAITKTQRQQFDDVQFSRTEPVANCTHLRHQQLTVHVTVTVSPLASDTGVNAASNTIVPEAPALNTPAFCAACVPVAVKVNVSV